MRSATVLHMSRTLGMWSVLSALCCTNGLPPCYNVRCKPSNTLPLPRPLCFSPPLGPHPPAKRVNYSGSADANLSDLMTRLHTVGGTGERGDVPLLHMVHGPGSNMFQLLQYRSDCIILRSA